MVVVIRKPIRTKAEFSDSVYECARCGLLKSTILSEQIPCYVYGRAYKAHMYHLVSNVDKNAKEKGVQKR